MRNKSIAILLNALFTRIAIRRTEQKWNEDIQENTGNPEDTTFLEVKGDVLSMC